MRSIFFLVLRLTLYSVVMASCFGTVTSASAQSLVPASNHLPVAPGRTTYGRSVNISGSNAIIGNLSKRTAYVFNTTTRTQTATLTPIGGIPNDNFGTSVAVSGDVAFVGAGGGNATPGGAYLFNATTGLQTAQLVTSDGAGVANFGYAVALSGNTALVTGSFVPSGSNTRQGAVYVFDATSGQQVRKLVTSDSAFGTSVALSGSLALIGSGTGPAYLTGSAYLFDTNTGQQTARLVPNGGADNSFFGYSVALSGNFALIGAPLDNVGAAYLFNVNTGQQLRKFTGSSVLNGGFSNLSPQFGYSVALSGNIALVGAFGDDVGSNNDQGAVYAFDITTGQQIARYSSADGGTGDHFGMAVSLDGTSALVLASQSDAPSNSSNQGQGTVYQFVVGAPEPGSILLTFIGGVVMVGVGTQKRRNMGKLHHIIFML